MAEENILYGTINVRPRSLSDVKSNPKQTQRSNMGSIPDTNFPYIENQFWTTSIAHRGGVLDEEDAVSPMLSLAGWVNVVEEYVD